MSQVKHLVKKPDGRNSIITDEIKVNVDNRNSLFSSKNLKKHLEDSEILQEQNETKDVEPKV